MTPAGADAALTGTTRRPRALVVEDDAGHVALLRRAFQRTGYDWSIEVASDLRSARQALFEDPPDAVLLDINLDGENGLDLLSWIRRQPSLGGTPVAVVSGAITGDPAAEALARGASLFLPKPWTVSGYESTVERLVHLLGGRSSDSRGR